MNTLVYLIGLDKCLQPYWGLPLITYTLREGGGVKSLIHFQRVLHAKKEKRKGGGGGPDIMYNCLRIKDRQQEVKAVLVASRYIED